MPAKWSAPDGWGPASAGGHVSNASEVAEFRPVRRGVQDLYLAAVRDGRRKRSTSGSAVLSTAEDLIDPPP
jgi:hypothetical protein